MHDVGSRAILSLTMAAVLLVACGSEPQTYSDCVLDGVKPGMSERAAALVAQACEEKHSPEARRYEAEVEILPDKALSQLKGRLGPSLGTWKGSIYNGNEEWRIDEITIAVSDTSAKNDAKTRFSASMNAAASSERYRVPLEIPPLSNREFELSVFRARGEAFEWKIESATGRRARRR
jgi:hypothetical protein